MAFKKSTINAAKVPSTLTDFPSYVDLSRIGITTLAQAQSSRFYADEAKLVELPREIVSATEGHVKVSSLTSTSDLYCDNDGIRSDYATTATYGAEAVWASTAASYRMSDTSNSEGNTSFNLNNPDSMSFVPGKMGDAIDFTETNTTRSLHTGANQIFSDTEIQSNWTVSMWIYPENLTSFTTFLRVGASTSGGKKQFQIAHDPASGRKLELYWVGGTLRHYYTNDALNLNDWNKVTFSVGTARAFNVYLNGSNVLSTTITAFDTRGDTVGLDRKINFGGDYAFGTAYNPFKGMIGDTQFLKTERSADWETTEYNNQSDEAAFWGDWEDVGGGTPEPDYTLTAETGAFALSGQTADFFTQYALTASSVALTLVGEAANIAATRLLSTSPGAFAVDGSDADLLARYTVSGAPAAFSVAGSGADILANYLLTGTAAECTLSGSQASLLRQLRLPCSAGAFLLEGNSADFYRQLRLACVPGSFVVSGNAVPLLASYRLSADAGTYTLEGQNASLSVEYKVTAQTAGFTVSGPAAAILARYAMPLATGTFTMVGNDATIDVVAYIQPFCPMDSPFEDAASAFEGSFSSFTPFSEGECE